MHVYKPEPEALDAAIANAKSKNRTWMPVYLQNVRRELLEDPERYKGYGMYWWLLKQALIESGVTDFGKSVDKEWFDNMTYGDTARNLAAADSYANYAIANGLFYSSTHPYSYLDEETSEKYGEECWEEALYVLSDDDMEELIGNNSYA